MSKTNTNCYIIKALELAKDLTILSDEGEAESSDYGCAVLYGIIRDSAYKIRKVAEAELEAHKTAGIIRQ